MTYDLKLSDSVLLTFSLERQPLSDFICEILWVNEEKRCLLPIGLDLTNDGVLSWLRHRSIPRNRGYVDALLSKLGLDANDTIGILNICYGLSLNDCYWVTPSGFSGSFDQYNLYDNEFQKALSLVAYTGYGSVKAKGFTSSPEFTTNGMLRKGWRRLGGEIILYKGGTEGAANAGREPYSEFYAAQIADAMQLNHISYGLSKWKGSVCSTCKLFTSKDISYVPIWRFGEFSSIPKIADYLRSMGDEYFDQFVDMMIFDAVIYNTDRHQGNFGLLVDSQTNLPFAPAPIFDNGLGLFPYAMDEDLQSLTEYAKTRSSAFGVPFDEIVKAYMTDRQRKQLRHLLTFEFSMDRNYNLPRSRVITLQSFIRRRAAELLSLS